MNILVAGATGRVGRYLVEQLQSEGHHVRALTRTAAKANFPHGVEVIEGDLTQPETIAGALEGVTGLHMITFGGDDYAPLQTGAELVALAEKAGVQRVTVLKGDASSTLEPALEASSLAWTYLVPVEFMSGALDMAASIRDEGLVRTGFADRRSAMVHDADIASVASAALTQDGHGGQSYTITGPEVLTPRDMIRIIGTELGRDIRLIELSEAEARDQWAAQGFSPEVIDFFVWVFGNTPPIGYTVVPTVEQVTGRPARTFAAWVAEHIAHFRGN